MASHRRTAIDARRRALSQNLLTDPSIAHRLVAASGVSPGDLVLEPGPGRGAVTRVLANRGCRVIGYELDPVLASGHPGVRVHRGDFRDAAVPREPFHVVGNIPFGATAGIVDWCLSAPGLLSATMITQLEYARKRSGDMGRWTRLTVSSWPWFEWRFLGRVGREAFRPRPSVDAGILGLVSRPSPLVPGHLAGEWRRAVDVGFSGVGGSLAMSLATMYPRRRVRRAFSRAGVGAGWPVGMVTAEEWVEVFRGL